MDVAFFVLVIFILMGYYTSCLIRAEKKAKEDAERRKEELERRQELNANYYFYQRTHPYNHDGNPFNDLPGASHIYGTDSYFHHHHWGP
ncbi:hypothetical protein QYE77_08965 [Thermanaerothrix sp. 4228-RoL]|uniref:Uncharacterized protein n=1 Tax=Thermanaerothrix solaris TaxID=3058434 RepID=A0ABU3NNI1_9CHLR|nr:hypothetical protein [Thermanaerothrix sp. 4228-RoL]MDT8898396.1 hypothetical protein [Thermanaerothrix sp. 4228-RoL]